jgi:hypothetical protein
MSGIDEHYVIGTTINTAYLEEKTDVMVLYLTVYTGDDQTPVFQIRDGYVVYKDELASTEIKDIGIGHKDKAKFRYIQ